MAENSTTRASRRSTIAVVALAALVLTGTTAGAAQRVVLGEYFTNLY